VALELDSLVRAVDALRRSVRSVDAEAGALSADLKETLRAGVIQNFEVAYEQCWKFTQRWLRENRAPEEADDPRTRKELFRAAARHGLVPDPLPWFEFGRARNMTSHTYDAAEAAAVYETARSFLDHAEDLLERLRERND
jgi:nucleotidyltransferase substrate binding protein (TIGR01987 family)